MSQITSYVTNNKLCNNKIQFPLRRKDEKTKFTRQECTLNDFDKRFQNRKSLQCRKFSLFKSKKKFVRKSENKIKVFSLLPFPVWATCTHSSLHESRSLSGCSGTIEIPSIASKDGQSWIETLSVFLRLLYS